MGFDFLRSIAIFLTLCRHSFPSSSILCQVGWAGVHIFFVLSSYLIANILFTEYYATGKVNVFRFFIRRALKIYPPYYLFILISVYKNRDLLFTSLDYRLHLAGQVFHVQNYTGPLWYHTWSLAAEEHFYLGICILLSVYIAVSKKAGLKNLSWLFMAVIVVVPMLRYRSTVLFHTDWFMGTHYIMDSFAFGALLALCKFIYPDFFNRLLDLKHWLLVPIFVLLIPLFLWPVGNLFLNSAGMTCMFIAFALMVMYLLSIETFSKSRHIVSVAIIRPLAWVGIASYSIYLFHVPVKTLVDDHLHIEWMRIPAYFLACVIVGKLAWYLIERPIALYKSNYPTHKK